MDVASGELEEKASEKIAIGNLYLFLSRMFLEPPGPDLLETLRDVVIPTLEKEVEQGRMPESLRNALGKLRDVLPLGEKATLDLIDKLAIDYTFLFRGYNKKEGPPPPYESIYLGGGLYGNSTMEVKKVYRSFDLEPKGRFSGEPPDHIGLQIAFLGNLTRMEADVIVKEGAEAAESIAIEKEKFVSRHLKWIRVLKDKVSKNDTTGFYSEIISLTIGWIEFNHPEF